MKYNCDNCGIFVAEIISGSKIKKETVFICSSCNSVRKIHKNYFNAGNKNSKTPFENIFGDIFKK